MPTPLEAAPLDVMLTVLESRLGISREEARDNLPALIHRPDAQHALGAVLARLQALADVFRAINNANEALARWQALDAAYRERLAHPGPLH